MEEQLPFGQSYWDYLPGMIQDYILDLAEKSHQRDLAAKALHKARMKDVCFQIKAHYHWKHFLCFLPSFERRQCIDCGETISPEFDMRRHKGLCKLKYWRDDDDEEEDFDGPLAHESFYSHLYPHTSRSSYTSPYLV